MKEYKQTIGPLLYTSAALNFLVSLSSNSLLEHEHSINFHDVKEKVGGHQQAFFQSLNVEIKNWDGRRKERIKMSWGYLGLLNMCV